MIIKESKILVASRLHHHHHHHDFLYRPHDRSAATWVSLARLSYSVGVMCRVAGITSFMGPGEKVTSFPSSLLVSVTSLGKTLIRKHHCLLHPASALLVLRTVCLLLLSWFFTCLTEPAMSPSSLLVSLVRHPYVSTAVSSISSPHYSYSAKPRLLLPLRLFISPIEPPMFTLPLQYLHVSSTLTGSSSSLFPLRSLSQSAFPHQPLTRPLITTTFTSTTTFAETPSSLGIALFPLIMRGFFSGSIKTLCPTASLILSVVLN
ncbi:hypothetical protein E2C01_090819 [Portunus trituberculatus]|uniref:Uncharacterized protein n=1 Tax=Portunus trituberculatus TaxID=210409 RepID=A0A5B7JFR9_PORTR|nr:hypothetical protein [Portunus trituberculatus]